MKQITKLFLCSKNLMSERPDLQLNKYLEDHPRYVVHSVSYAINPSPYMKDIFVVVFDIKDN